MNRAYVQQDWSEVSCSCCRHSPGEFHNRALQHCMSAFMWPKAPHTLELAYTTSRKRASTFSTQFLWLKSLCYLFNASQFTKGLGRKRPCFINRWSIKIVLRVKPCWHPVSPCACLWCVSKSGTYHCLLVVPSLNVSFIFLSYQSGAASCLINQCLFVIGQTGARPQLMTHHLTLPRANQTTAAA